MSYRMAKTFLCCFEGKIKNIGRQRSIWEWIWATKWCLEAKSGQSWVATLEEKKVKVEDEDAEKQSIVWTSTDFPKSWKVWNSYFREHDGEIKTRKQKGKKEEKWREWEDKPQTERKIFAKDTSERELLSETFKELIYLKNEQAVKL